MTNTGGSQTSPRRQRSFFGNGSEWSDGQNYQATAPIGSKRTVSMGPESSSQTNNPLRQARGPNSSSGLGFNRRQNGRGSDELRTAASAIAE
jgi:hypothetical protein